jgi:hypothetical protein
MLLCRPASDRTVMLPFRVRQSPPSTLGTVTTNPKQTMKTSLSAALVTLSLLLAGTASAATVCTADVAKMKRLEDRALVSAGTTAPVLSGVTLAVAKSLDNAGMAVPSSAPGTGLSLADAKKLDRMPAPGRARDIAGGCL